MDRSLSATRSSSSFRSVKRPKTRTAFSPMVITLRQSSGSYLRSVRAVQAIELYNLLRATLPVAFLLCDNPYWDPGTSARIPLQTAPSSPHTSSKNAHRRIISNNTLKIASVYASIASRALSGMCSSSPSIFRSTFLPRIVGALMALAGFGYMTLLYAPLAHYLHPYNLAPGALSETSLTQVIAVRK